MKSELLALSKVCELITIIKKQKSQKLTSNWSNYNRTRLTFEAGTHEGSCSWNTLPGKYPNQYRRRARRGSWMMKRPDWGMVTSYSKKISQFDWPTWDTSCHGKQISVQTRELAPETDSCNRFAPGTCSLISNQLEIVGADEGALLHERVAWGSSIVCTMYGFEFSL